MINPDRALVALATLEDVFTPDGAAVTLSEIYAEADGPYDFRFVAKVFHTDESCRVYPLAELTARDGIEGAA